MLARNPFLENIDILILFRMLSTRFKYPDPIIKKAKNNFEKIEIRNKTKTHRLNQKTDFYLQSHKKEPHTHTRPPSPHTGTHIHQ